MKKQYKTHKDQRNPTWNRCKIMVELNKFFGQHSSWKDRFLIPPSQHPGHKVWPHKRKKFTKKMCSSPYPKRTCFFVRWERHESWDINKTVRYLLENFTPKNGKTHVSLFSSPDPKGHVSYSHHLASVVRRTS